MSPSVLHLCAAVWLGFPMMIGVAGGCAAWVGRVRVERAVKRINAPVMGRLTLAEPSDEGGLEIIEERVPRPPSGPGPRLMVFDGDVWGLMDGT